MAEKNSPRADQAAIRRIVERFAAAHHARDVEAIIACYAPDALICDLAPPLVRRGPDREGLAVWLDTWETLDLSVHDLEVSAEARLAFATALHRLTGRKRAGEDVDIWMRSTACLRKSDRRWQIVHEHTSVPFHMDGSLKAAIDLKPPFVAA